MLKKKSLHNIWTSQPLALWWFNLTCLRKQLLVSKSVIETNYMAVADRYQECKDFYKIQLKLEQERNFFLQKRSQVRNRKLCINPFI